MIEEVVDGFRGGGRGRGRGNKEVTMEEVEVISGEIGKEMTHLDSL